MHDAYRIILSLLFFVLISLFVYVNYRARKRITRHGHREFVLRGINMNWAFLTLSFWGLVEIYDSVTEFSFSLGDWINLSLLLFPFILSLIDLLFQKIINPDRIIITSENLEMLSVRRQKMNLGSIHSISLNGL